MTKPREDQLVPSKALQFVLLTSVRVSDTFDGGREKSEPFKWKPELARADGLAMPLIVAQLHAARLGRR